MPAMKRRAIIKENAIDNTRGSFFFANQLHNGFNKMASIKENAIGISISLRLAIAYTKRVIPNNITVLLK